MQHVHSTEQAFLFDAVRTGNIEDVEKLLDLFPELINAVDAKCYSPLIIAAYNDHESIVAFLLKRGANVNAADAAGNTALMGAAFKGYTTIVKALIDAGAEVNLRNQQDAPALTFAATFGRLEIAELLLDNGSQINLADNRGKTSYDHAVLQENEEMITLLKKYL